MLGAPAQIAAAATALLAPAAPPAAVPRHAARAASAVVAEASPAEVTLGGAVTVTGTAAQGPGAVLELQGAPWPSRSFTTFATTTSGPGGTFAFPALRPDRNTALRVTLAGQPGSAAGVNVTVDPRITLRSHSLGPGRVLLSLGVRHAIFGRERETQVSWFVAAAGSRVFHFAAATAGRETRPGLLDASAIVDPPAARFVFRVCLNPAWEAAMGPPSAHGPCPRGGFVLPEGRR
jgi:hypothetical protein